MTSSDRMDLERVSKPIQKQEIGTATGIDTVHVPTGLYEERVSPDKGIGVFALTSIPKGQRLLCEPPLLALPDEEDVCDLYRNVKALPSEKQAAFWALAGSTKPPQEVDFVHELRASYKDGADSFDALVEEHKQAWTRFVTNRFTMRGSDGSIDKMGVFSNAARFNHSCTPNVYHRFNSNINCLTMHALRTISPGEEIYTSYIDICHNTMERRRILRHWGFKCGCDSCRADDIDQNWRRHKLEDLMARMKEGESKRYFESWSDLDYASALTTIEEIINLMIKDGMEETDTLGEAYANAAEYCLVIGRKQDAIKWAEKNLEVDQKCCGEDSPEYAEAVELLESAIHD